MDGELLELIGLIYEAAQDPSRWQVFLRRYAAALKFHVAQIEVSSSVTEASVAATFGLTASDAADFRDAAQYSPWLPLIRDVRPGTVGASHRFVSDEDYVRGVYYQEYGRRIDQYYGQAGLITRSGSMVSILGGIRSKAMGPCGLQEEAFLEVLMPHLERALRMHAEFRQLRAESRALLQSLDRLSRGIVLMNESGCVLRVNCTAERMIAGQDGLHLSTNGLRATDLNESAELQRLIHGAAKTAAGAGFSAGGIVTISRPSMRRPWIAVVSPHKTENGEGLAAVLLIDPEEKPMPSWAALARAFRLTKSEAKIAQMLAMGMRLEEVAERLEITINTARTHTRRILEKTGVRRQADLILLLARMPGSVA